MTRKQSEILMKLV